MRIVLPRLGAAASLRREIRVPYASVLLARRGRGRVPGLFIFRLGAHLPGSFAYGTFWRDGARRFLYFRKGDPTLHLDLEGHAFESVEVAAADPEGLAREVRARVPGK